jgi:phenylpropionate dioxygenase-like ring-hydroxylating dioxygenase large terminal subunit
MRVFDNPDVLPSTWYAVAPSAELARGQARRITLHDRRIALFRGEDGVARALDARCPHLGADLGRGTVVGDRLRCEFHHWAFDGAGACRHAPGTEPIPASARTFAYPVEERHGFVWVWNGRAPAFAVPGFEDWRDDELVAVPQVPVSFPCHAHVAACNGLDIRHMATLHAMRQLDPPQILELDRFRLQVRYRMAYVGRKPTDRVVRALTGGAMDLRFTTWGGNTAVAEIRHPRFPLLLVFTHRPLADGGTDCQTIVFLPRSSRLRGRANWLKYPLTILLVDHFLGVDVGLFETIRFWPRLTPGDEALGRYIRQVEGLETFDPRRPAREDLGAA